MTFTLPTYHAPNFGLHRFMEAPDVRTAAVTTDGVAPEGFHSTSMFPEYFRINGEWVLAEESRMDASVVLDDGPLLRVVENRNLKVGDRVILGRTEDGEDGIYVHSTAFVAEPDTQTAQDRFVFRAGRSRETAYSRDYDELIELLKFEKDHGHILWVMGPAFAFDADSRWLMQRMIEAGYVDGLLAGNALATHDLEGAHLHTALGQDIYTQASVPGGHYHHLDVINRVRRSGSIPAFIRDHGVTDGIMYALVNEGIPYVLTGSIRDDGPLPEVYSDAYRGAAAMRDEVRKATTVICLATMLHTIATGNMTPSFRQIDDPKRGTTLRPLYLYTVDADEFVVNKLLDRGSLAAKTFVTNVQDFIRALARGLDL